MRIISPFKDYYDCIQAYGYSPEPKYIRNIIRENIDSFSFIGNTNIGGLTAEKLIVGFCGNVYPALAFYEWQIYNQKHKYTYFYDYDKAVAYIKSRLSYKKIADLEKIPSWRRVESFKSLDRFFKLEYNIDIKGYLTKLFLNSPHPIFTVSRFDYTKDILTWNDNLGQINFQQVFDNYSAFQEIERYLSNIAFPNPVIPDVSDKDMIVAKGFDKFSFRKDKSKK